MTAGTHWGRVAVGAGLLAVASAAIARADDEALPPEPKGVINLMGSKAAPPSGRTFTEYRDGSGVPTLTNRHQAYRNDPNFIETQVEFRPIVVPGRYRNYGSPSKYTGSDLLYLVRQYSRQYGLDENLVLAVIRAESNFNPYAVSRAGARGLMQLMPGTAAEMGVRDIFDPAQNIAGGTQYLAQMLKLFRRNLPLALAAYNAGPSTVQKYGGVPPYEETKNYVERVQRFTRQYARGELRVGGLATAHRLPPTGYLPNRTSPLLVRFHSGQTQPADAVQDIDPFYIIQFAGRSYTIRKSLVKEVTKNT